MLGFRKRGGAKGAPANDVSPRVSAKLCTDRYNGKYPLVGLYDCRERKVWVAKPLSGQAIRTSHAALITGIHDATSTVWKDRFLCFWFYTPNTGEGYILGYPIDWEEAHLLIRIDRQWDYDRQRIIPPELEDQIEENLSRQLKHGERIWDFFRDVRPAFPINLHFIGQRATDSQFYVKRQEGHGK
jgi:hypothetical protein